MCGPDHGPNYLTKGYHDTLLAGDIHRLLIIVTLIGTEILKNERTPPITGWGSLCSYHPTELADITHRVLAREKLGLDALDVPHALGLRDGHLGDGEPRLQRLERNRKVALAVDDRRLHAVVSTTQLIRQEGTVLEVRTCTLGFPIFIRGLDYL